MSAPVKLDGEVVVVTGCTRGFGRVLVSDLARAGARVVVSSPFKDENEELVEEFTRAGLVAIAAPGDVTDRDQMRALAAAAADEFGRLDVWVNNAAYETPGMSKSLDFGDEIFDAVNSVNVVGTYNGTMAALRVMLEQGDGTIINVTGRGDDLRPAMYTNPYGASKAWIRSFTRTLRNEYGKQGVNIVGFNPGVMNTERMDRAEAEQLHEIDPRLEKIYPVVMRVLGDPPQVASARLVQFIASGGAAKKGEFRLITPVKVVKGASAEAARWGKEKVADLRG
jgi:NAD(P)-dependent dehydrogenase (short-subunit alcohol dehydrogenase family)